MREAHTVEMVRAAEAALMARLPEGTLMQRAASGLATAVADLLGRAYGAQVLLLVGSGDNGGDTLYAGARLAARGARVEAVLLSANAHPEGLAAVRGAGGRVVTAADARRPDLLLDGIVGIGGRPGLRPDAVEALGRFPDVPIVAVDVPSGVGVDDGRLAGPHVTAELTVTFGTHKPCHLVGPAVGACGVVHLVDIGLELPEAPITALGRADVRALLRWPESADHKYTRGVVGVRTGSERYPGAAVIGVAAANAGLAGMVRYVGSAAASVLARHPEVVVGEGRVQAWLVGSGGGDGAGEELQAAAADGVPVVVDADALQHVRDLDAPPPMVLTPHAGELAAMLGVEREQVEADPLGFVRRAAREYDAVVLLKGRRTLVADPAGRIRVNTTGTPWLAVAGAGDVLAGIIGALLASGLSAYDAASVGAWLHGSAATLASGGGPITAMRAADAVPLVVRGLRE